MALINCPECNNQVSSQAVICPKCGFPIADYVDKEVISKEFSRLTKQIKPYSLSLPKPRVKVCIKCAKPFSFDLSKNEYVPDCGCQFHGEKYPGVEVNYANGGRYYTVGAHLYILNHFVIPYNIGDKESKEYTDTVNALFSRIEECNAAFPNRPVKEVKPNPQDYNHPVYEATRSAQPKQTKTDDGKNIPHCPICNSTKLKQISAVKKASKISLFGIYGAGDLGKTWQCENCGSKF